MAVLAVPTPALLDAQLLLRGRPAPPELLYAMLSAALFPQVAYLHAPATKKGPCGPDMVRLHIREPNGTAVEPQVAAIHPSSITCKLNPKP